ncbi:MAG: carboxylesterase/lipase family protein [Alphaproteobacteria bacterium]|nr:carboxylesterase/lipase family protein [Alphaproteobacteria bacterium]
MESVVRVRAGKVRGRLAGGLHAFLGVPYAAPPVGGNRFRSPRPVESWSGIRDALSFGARPLQPIAPPEIAAMAPDPSANGDDCLNLNIWTKTLDGSGMPVMVWIPGGMFEVGSGATYDGSRFARDDVVCVTINYRVGASGFLYLDEGEANFGLLDQIAALTWVRDNIAAFGGDPANVTIFGESAGAMSIGALLSMPRAQGMFRRAILQSGGPSTVMSAETAMKTARRLSEKLAVPLTREALAAVPDERLLAAQTELKEEVAAAPDPVRWGDEVVATMMPFHTVVDGSIVPAPPITRIAAGASRQVDVIAGSNTQDWKMFVVANGLMGRITDDIATGPVAKHGFQSLAAYGLPAEKALAAYRAVMPGASGADILAAVQTDWWCRIPAIRLAEARVGAPGATYMYEFAWPSPAAGGLFGACHALEIAFVFDTLDKGADQMLGPLLGPEPPQSLADAMHKAWVAFAATGNPGWPKYDIRHRATMRFDAVSKVIDDPRRWERELWQGVR